MFSKSYILTEAKTVYWCPRDLAMHVRERLQGHQVSAGQWMPWPLEHVHPRCRGGESPRGNDEMNGAIPPVLTCRSSLFHSCCRNSSLRPRQKRILEFQVPRGTVPARRQPARSYDGNHLGNHHLLRWGVGGARLADSRSVPHIHGLIDLMGKQSMTLAALFSGYIHSEFSVTTKENTLDTKNNLRYATRSRG